MHDEIVPRCLCLEARDFVAIEDQIIHIGQHAQAEARIALGVFDKEIEEVPLRHERDKFAPGEQMRTVGEGHKIITDDAAELLQLLMRARKKIIEQAELVHHLQGRRVDRVTAEIT